MQSSNPFGRPPRRGLTLVEVVASLALLSTLVVGILLAYGAHQRQLQDAEQRLEALDVVDRLLVNWYGGALPVPVGGSGQVAGSTRGWWWKSSVIRRQTMGNAPFQIVRLEVYPLTRQNVLGPMRSSIDVLVAAPTTDLLPGD